MTSTHSDDVAPRKSGVRWGRIALALVFTGAVAQGAYVALSDEAAPESVGRDVQSGNRGSEVCGEQRITIAADPRIVSVVRNVVQSLPENECATIAVVQADSAAIAKDVRRQGDRGLGGTLPDVWIADSTLWIDHAAATDEGAERIVTDPVSIASTPIVVAVKRDVATRAGWPQTQPTWTQLVNNAAVRVGLSDPTLDAVALAVVEAHGGSDRLGELASQVALPALNGRTAAALVADGLIDAMPTTEQDVVERAEIGTPLVAAYDANLGALDFPLVQIAPLGTEPNAEVSQLVEDLIAAADSDAASSELGSFGLRDADGNSPDTARDVDAVDWAAELGSPLAMNESAKQTVDTWAESSRRSRLLVVFDMSGSMAEDLPGGLTTRAAAGQQALEALIGSSAPDNQIGLWGFTTEIGNGNYQEFVSVGELSSPVAGGGNREALLLDAVTRLNPVDGGSTSLYDTVSAAYEVASADYTFGRLNAVVIITDGVNEDPDSVSLEQLRAQLQRQFDGTKPLRIIAIAYGEEADLGALQVMADVTGGTTYVALSADEIVGVIRNIGAEM